jgi:hypothetical protein
MASTIERTTEVWTGVVMSAIRTRRIPQICLALLGAMAISCGTRTVYVVAPAPAGAPAQPPAAPAPEVVSAPPRGGLAQEPEPAPVVIPAPPPVVVPAPPPVVVPNPAPRNGASGGAPRGVLLIEASDPSAMASVSAWLKRQQGACKSAGQPKQCLHVTYDPNDFNPNNKKCPVKNVSVDDSSSIVSRDKNSNKKYVKPKSAVTVTINLNDENCDYGKTSGNNNGNGENDGNSRTPR